MEMVKDSLTWFEIPVLDFERARQFYSRIFDYEMPDHQFGPNRMGFLLSEQGLGVGGAIVQGEGHVPSENGTLVYLNGGTDLSIVLNRVADAGGKVLLEKTQISPALGYYAVFNDTEGNKLALHSLK